MNKLEESYSLHLDYQVETKLVVDWKYEAVKLRLAHTCFYTPDFFVLMPDGTIELHETKGPYAYEDSIIKLKVAASLYPMFNFRLVKRTESQGWKIAEVKRSFC